MCFGGGNATDPANAEGQLSAYRRAKAQASTSAGTWDANALGAKPAGWDSWDSARRSRYLANGGDYDAGPFGGVEGRYKAVLQDQYTDPTTGLRKGQVLAGDATDDALKKARTNFMLRTQLGKNQKSSLATGQLGGFDVSKPVLGGY
jgi:hypothetical protein